MSPYYYISCRHKEPTSGICAAILRENPGSIHRVDCFCNTFHSCRFKRIQSERTHPVGSTWNWEKTTTTVKMVLFWRALDELMFRVWCCTIWHFLWVPVQRVERIRAIDKLCLLPFVPFRSAHLWFIPPSTSFNMLQHQCGVQAFRHAMSIMSIVVLLSQSYPKCFLQAKLRPHQLPWAEVLPWNLQSQVPI